MNRDFAKRRRWGPEPRYEMVENYEPQCEEFKLIAGPCSVENHSQIWNAALVANAEGATHLRGGVFRAGTYPGSKFGWIPERLVKEYYLAAEHYGLDNIIELLDYRDVDRVGQYCSAFQIGARQMQNYTLLKVAAQSGKTIFLKRNPGATLDEWLGSAEWLLSSGCEDLYLIERGSVSHVDHVRWDLSISMIPAAKKITRLPIIVDASHGTGRSDLVTPMTLAGIAAGAAGALIEFHQDPDNSLSDAEQALSIEEFKKTVTQLRSLEHAMSSM